MRYIFYMFVALFSGLHVTDQTVMVGDTPVILRHYQHGQANHHFIHVHHNETTALKAAKILVKVEGGSVLTLVHAGGRNIVFHLNHQRFEFDPNRIYSDRGIKKTLSQFGPYTLAAHREVKQLARQIIKQLPPGKVVAVHNNETYSLKNYLQGQDMAQEAQQLHVDQKQFYRNFYVVTKHCEFNRLKQLKFNSVLQAQEPTDDGSLSVYLAKRNYINVEAGYHQLFAQIKMLRYA